MALFQLTDTHIRNGHLSDEDFSAVAGFNVKTFELSDFPHYSELMEVRELPQYKIDERAESIYAALRAANLTLPENQTVITNSRKVWFPKEDARSVANVIYPTVQSRIEKVWDYVPISQNIPHYKHFSEITTRGFYEAHKESYILWHRIPSLYYTNASYVFPGMLEEEASNLKLYFRTASFLLLDRNMSAKASWAHMARIPEDLLQHYPLDDAHSLKSDLHEQRHLQQLLTHPSTSLADFYRELDADMAAKHILARKNIGQETIVASLHLRYLDMLRLSPHYWFAASLEAIEKRQKPTTFQQTYRAVAEIRLRLGLEKLQISHAEITSVRLQHAIHEWDSKRFIPSADGSTFKALPFGINTTMKFYDGWSNALGSRSPSPIYTTLRQLCDKGVFTDPFSNFLAERIISAANYFNPELAHADKRPSLVRKAKDFLHHLRR